MKKYELFEQDNVTPYELKGFDVRSVERAFNEAVYPYTNYKGEVSFCELDKDEFKGESGIFEFKDHVMTRLEDHGGEGQGDQYWVVFKIETKDLSECRYYKWSGYYASYDGGYLENLYEVTPTIKTITVYKKIKTDD